MQAIRQELSSITDVVIKNIPGYVSMGLLSGVSGSLLLLRYYSKYIDDSYCERVDELESDCILNVGNGKFRDCGYCNGLSGVLEVFNHLNERELSTISTSEADEFFKNYLWGHIERLLDEEKYDFLYGIIGMIQPFFHFDGGTTYVHRIIDRIYDSVEKRDGIISYPFRNMFTNEKEANLSISHGLVSVVDFLIKAYNYGIDREKCRILIEGFINYFLTQKIDRTKYHSCYPYIAIDHATIRPSRLAWCYGDLSIALMYWEAGKAMGNPLWKQEAIDILDFATTRLDLERNQVKDACICHGTSGIALIFNKMHKETHCSQYKDARNYWVSKTLDFGKKNGIDGYKMHGHKNTQTDIGLLEGLTGVGLMFIACEDKDGCSDWDRLLFIN